MPPSAEFGIIRDIIVYYFKIFKLFSLLKRRGEGSKMVNNEFQIQKLLQNMLKEEKKMLSLKLVM